MELGLKTVAILIYFCLNTVSDIVFRKYKLNLTEIIIMIIIFQIKLHAQNQQPYAVYMLIQCFKGAWVQ